MLPKVFLQVKDVDYQKTFSLTAKVTSVKVLMQVAAQESLIIEQMDLKCIYPNAEIDCKLHIEQPFGYDFFLIKKKIKIELPSVWHHNDNPLEHFQKGICSFFVPISKNNHS